jgi:LAS superfamily LD-carboxypeptidase LdcB
LERTFPVIVCSESPSKLQIACTVASFNFQASLGKGYTVAAVGFSPHGWGGEIDFGELYQLASGGSGNPAINANVRNTSTLYKWLATNGPKYNWFNPYRLADGGGVDECWHWEYWGPNIKP